MDPNTMAAASAGARPAARRPFRDASDQVVGARWFCTNCHASRTDAKALVGNSFEPAPGK